MSKKLTISTHILDTSLGKAADNVPVIVYRLNSITSQWEKINEASTNSDGRVPELIKSDEFQTGYYKVHFNTKEYFKRSHTGYLYPFIEVIVDIQNIQHYHIPLLLNPFGYSTYRGT